MRRHVSERVGVGMPAGTGGRDDHTRLTDARDTTRARRVTCGGSGRRWSAEERQPEEARGKGTTCHSGRISGNRSNRPNRTTQQGTYTASRDRSFSSLNCLSSEVSCAAPSGRVSSSSIAGGTALEYVSVLNVPRERDKNGQNWASDGTSAAHEVRMGRKIHSMNGVGKRWTRLVRETSCRIQWFNDSGPRRDSFISLGF